MFGKLYAIHKYCALIATMPFSPLSMGKLFSSSFRRKFNFHVILETLVYTPTPI